MKLHLPKQLFTALLAAITLATPATLTLGSTAWGEITVSTTDGKTTVSNGAGWEKEYTSVSENAIPTSTVGATIITSGSLTAAWSENFNLDDYGGDIIVGRGANLFLQTWTSNNYTEGHDLDISGHDIYIGTGDSNVGAIRLGGWSGDITLGNITLLEDAAITKENAGANNHNVIFAGKVSGSYTLTLKGQANGHYFDNAQFAGDIDLSGLTLASGSEVLLDGTTTTTTVKINSLTNSGALTLGNTKATITTLINNSNASVTVNNGATLALGAASINSGSMNIKSGAKLTGTLTNNGTLSLADFTLDAGTAASITGTGTTTLSGTVTNNGTLELGGTLDFSAATLSTETALITLGSGASLQFDSGTIFKFADLTAGTTYKFINASVGTLTGWESITAEQIYIGGVQLNSSGYSITTSGGVFSFAQLISSLTWTGSANDGIWNTSSQNWTTGSAASAYVNAIDTSFISDAAATVTEAIIIGNLTIGGENAQTAPTVTLSAGEGASLALTKGKTLSMGANSTLNSALGIDVSAATVSMGEGASWNLTGTAQQNLTEAQLNCVTDMNIGETASLTVDTITTAAGSMVNASQLSGTGGLTLKLQASGNGVQFNLRNFEGVITVDNAEGQGSGNLMVNGSSFHSKASFTLLQDGALVFNAGAEEAPTTLSNHIIVTNTGSASEVGVGSSVYVNSGLYAEISGNISGTGQLFKKGGGTLSLSGNTTVSALKVMDGTLNLGGAASLSYLGVGGGNSVEDSTVLNITGTVSATQLRMGEQGHAAVNIKSGGSLTINGTVSDANTNRSLLLTHWGKDSTLTLDGGNLTSTGARMFLSWTGTGTFKALSGTANLLGIDFLAQDSSIKGNFYLGDESNGAGSARVNIGANGIANVDNAAVVIKLGEGTLGALSDWEMAANTNNAGNVQLISTNGGTVFNTEDANTPGTGHTITINAALSGSGKLVKDGVGTLKLSGANTYTGGTTVKGGILQIASGGSAGTGAVEVQTGATLDVAALPTDWTAASMLSGKVTGTGTLLISQSGLATGNANLTTTFGGTLELAKGITFTLGATGAGNSGDAKVIDTTTLAGVVLNAGESAETGSKLQYHADGNSTLTNLTVNALSENEKGTATLNYVDSNKNNALRLDGVTQLDGNLDITTQFDGGVLIKQLSGAGNLSVTGGNGIFNASIESIQNKYTGSLSFSDDQLNATVSTGTGEGTLSMGSITASGVASFTFNVQRNTELTSLAAASNANVNLADGVTLSLSGATDSAIGTLSAASGATLTLDTNASLTVGTYNAMHTLTISGSGASAGLGFTSITVDNNSHQLTLEGDGVISFVHNRDAVDNASADGNGFRVNTGKYVLFDGYEWTADENHTLTADGFTLDENQADGKTILISSGVAGDVFYVNKSNATAYDAGFVTTTLDAGTAVEILAGQTLSVETATDVTLSKELRGEGSLSKSGAGTLTLSGATSFGGSVNVSEGTLTLSGATSFGGSVNVSEGSLNVTGALTAGAITKSGAGTLYLKDGIGNQKIRNLTITGGIVRTDQGDALAYDSDTTMSIQNATLDLDARQTVDSSNSFELNSGTISGDGGANGMKNDVKVGLEVHNGSTLKISSAGTSSITTNIGFRNAEGKVEYTVTNGTLTNSGIIASNSAGTTGAVVKKGAGELILSGANTYANGTTVEAGTLTVNHASALGTGSVLLKTGSILTLGATVTNAIQVGVQEDETKNWAEITLSNNAELDHGTKVTTNNDTKVAYTVNSGSTLSISNDGNTSNIESLNIAGGTVKLSAWNASLGSSADAVDMTLSNDGMFSFTNGNSDSNGGKMYLNVEVDGSGKLAGSNWGNDSDIIGIITSNGAGDDDILQLGQYEDYTNWWTVSATIKDNENGTDKLKVQKVDDKEVVLNGVNTYSGGTEITGGTLTIKNIGALGSGKVTVSEAAKLKLDVGGTISFDSAEFVSGAGTVTIANGTTLQLSYEGGTPAVAGGTIDVTAGGTLLLDGKDRLGWESSTPDSPTTPTSAVILTGSKEGETITYAEMQLGDRQTHSAEISMNGYAKITAYNNADSAELNQFNKNGAIINVSGLDNTIAVNLGTRDALLLNVEEGGELLVSGKVYANGEDSHGTDEEKSYDTGSVVKQGAGLVEFSNAENTFEQKYVNEAGTTLISGTSSFAEGINVIDGTLKVSGTNSKVGTLKLGSAATITSQQGTDASMTKAAVNSSGISSTATDGTKGTLSDADIEIAQLQEDASFTIADMTLSNVKLSAVEGASVALNNVSGTAELAGAGSYNIGTGAAQYTLGMTPAQVGTIENDNGGTALTLSYSSNTAITMSGTGSRLLLSADPTVDANGIFGTYNLTLTLNYTLNGIDTPTTTEGWQELVGFTGILGDLLTAQTPEATVDLAEGEAAVAAAGTTPTVEYNYKAPGEGAEVGMLVITINGLNVPEPASATLGLAALMMLCARRRRKA